MTKTILLMLYSNLRKWHRLPRFGLCLCLLFITVLVQAQSTVKGKVTDEVGAGMPGVNVLLKGTTTGTTSDVNGDYTIAISNVDNDAILVFSFIGYSTIEQAIGGRTTIDVKLEPSIQSLNEIVVVGYGTQKKSDVTGSLVSVSSEALREVPVANLQQALQGRAAGVDVQRIGTAPGATARIRIRGERSLLGSNDPLIVLDGIPYEGSLTDINPDEIASINVLKDASATAIYGSRGANGIILITTKRGAAGETKLTFNSYIGVTTVARKYDLYNAEEYAAMRDASAWPNGYMPAEVEGMKVGRNTDWQDLMYENGIITDQNLGISGGTDNSQYAVSAGYFKETTILPGQGFERFSIKSSVDSKIGKKLKIGLTSLNTLSYSTGTQFVNQQPAPAGSINGTNGAYGGSILYNILANSPLMPAYDANGDILQRPAGNIDDAAANYSPLYLKHNTNDWVDKIRRIRSFNSFFAEYQIIDGLTYRFNLGLDFSQSNGMQFQGQDSYFRPNNLYNRARVRNEENLSWTAENVVTYNKTIAEDHRFTFTGLFSAQRSSGYATQVNKDQVTADFVEFYNLNLSDPSIAPVLDGGEQTWSLLSYMGRINYAFKDRYLLTLTYRNDGSSRLAQKWHDYPAIAAGWNVMNESFMQSVPVLSNLKLRVGYGQTSNQAVAPYASLGGVKFDSQGVPIRYNYGTGTLVSGSYASKIPDKTLDWEYTKTTNIGIDFGLLDDRITGTIDWYKAETNNLLFEQRLPISSGYEDLFQTNIGNMENKGLEIALSAVAVKTAGGFTWSLDVNWYYNRNKLVKYLPNVTKDIANGIFVGHPVTAIYDYKKLGIWQTSEAAEAATFGQLPGQIKFADISGPNGEPDGQITADDRTIIGSQQPDWQGGITNRFSYKGFDLSFVAFMRKGGTLLSYLHAPNGAYLTSLNGQRNGLDVDYWTPTNPTNEFPAPSATLPAGASTGWSTLAYYDGSFVKMRSINLGYTLPSAVLNKIKAKAIRVYVTAQNPFLLYCPYVFKHHGVDPEPTGQGQTGIVATAGNYRTSGPNQNLVISASTPPTRSFIVGLNLTF